MYLAVDGDEYVHESSAEQLKEKDAHERENS